MFKAAKVIFFDFLQNKKALSFELDSLRNREKISSEYIQIIRGKEKFFVFP